MKIEEKWARDPLGGVVLGFILILAGGVFFLVTNQTLTWDTAWGYFLLGVGVILLLEVLIRYTMPEYRRPIFGRLIFGVILVLIGGSGIVGIEEWWPLLLIVIGVLVIIGALTQSRRSF
ncbi:MAG: hypothetical protein ACE5NP_13645 [Anaerolineae bacterium]